jgi:hypothetical protein
MNTDTFISFINRFSEYDPLLVESIKKGYFVIHESTQDRYKFDTLNKIFDKHKPKITEYYQKVFESLYKNTNKIPDMYIELDNIDDKYRHLESMSIIFTSDKGDEAKFIKKGNQRSIIVPIPSKIYELVDTFKSEYLTAVQKLFPDVDPDVAYEYLSNPGNLGQYKFDDGSNLFTSYITIWKKYKSIVSDIVNTTTRGILTHELVHAMDDSDFNLNTKDVKTKYQYYNSPHERNAYLIGLLSEINMNSPFNDIISNGKLKQYLDIMSPSNKKRMIKRIHDIWNNMYKSESLQKK